MKRVRESSSGIAELSPTDKIGKTLKDKSSLSSALFHAEIAELRKSDTLLTWDKYYITWDKYYTCVIEVAEKYFKTPAEYSEHAIPYLINKEDLNHGSHSEYVLPLIEKWGLTSLPKTVIAVMDYVAHDNNWSGSDFVKKYGYLAKKYLPKDKMDIVFNRLLEHLENPIPQRIDINSQAELLVNTLREYVTKDKWPAAYETLKKLLVHATKKHTRDNRFEINSEKVELLAETLMRFGIALPVNAEFKKHILNDVTTLLQTPEKFFPHRKVIEKKSYFNLSQKSNVLFEAIVSLSSAGLDIEDYETIVSFIKDKNNNDNLSDKIDIIKACAEKSIPKDTRDERVVTDILDLVKISLERNPYANNLSAVAQAMQSGFAGLNLTDEHRWKYKCLIENYSIKLATNNGIADKQLYAIFNKVAHTLTPKQTLAWMEEMTEHPFLTSDIEKNQDVIPFVEFLSDQFKLVVGKQEVNRIVATTKIAAGYVAEEFVMVLGNAVIKPTQKQEKGIAIFSSLYDKLTRLFGQTAITPNHVVFSANELSTAQTAEKAIIDKSIDPEIQSKNIVTYHKIVAALNQKARSSLSII